MTFESAKTKLLAMLDEEFSRRGMVHATLDLKMVESIVRDGSITVNIRNTQFHIAG